MVSSVKLLREHGLSPKKSFGQNFLQDAALCGRIAELATLGGVRTVLEIGAGLGALTAPLLERSERVIAIERDRDLVPILRERLAASEGLEVVEGDAVRADWEALWEGAPVPRAIAGNLPYQLTGRLLRRVGEHAQHIARAVLMVQREVAERLVAAPASKDYGALTVFTQARFTVERAIDVSAGAFVPRPNVGSAVVVMTPAARAEETPLFRALVQAAFAARRKKLRNAWRSVGPDDVVAAAAARAGVDLSVRGETLTVEHYAAVAAALATVLDPP